MLSAIDRWGIRTLGELAALPPADLAARLGQQGLLWQALARGEDVRPLVPDTAEERFESSLELEWPIEGLEPLSFVLTRLLEPLSTRLERRDRGAAVLYVELGWSPAPRQVWSRSMHVRRLRAAVADARRADAAHAGAARSRVASAAAAIDRVTIVIDPDTGACAAAHAVHARAPDARAALDAPRTARRADGTGPHRRAVDGRLVSSRSVRRDTIRGRSRGRRPVPAPPTHAVSPPPCGAVVTRFPCVSRSAATAVRSA